MRIAGIVLYNPDIQRLHENIDGIINQVDLVILIDNGSRNLDEVQIMIKNYSTIELICNNKNMGIARALNQIGEKAENLKADWFLTLDQDSVCQSGLISEYEKVINNPDIAIVTCEIKDRNFDMIEANADKMVYISTCITSGSFMNTAIWKRLGGFDEKLFIDKVDTDYCFRAIHESYKIAKIHYYGLLHEVGYGTSNKSFGNIMAFKVFNHSAMRCYYITRNQIYFARKHSKQLGISRRLRYERTAWTRIVVYLFYEHNKLEKMKAWIKGLRDGYKMEV